MTPNKEVRRKVTMHQIPIPVELNFVDCKCPYCGNPVSFRDEWIGHAHRCPNCRQIVIVPNAGVEVAARLPIPFRTSRILLRRLIPTDSRDLFEVVGDEDMLRYCEWYAMDEKEVENWLVREEKGAPFHHHQLNLALELVEQNKVIGFVKLGFLDDDNPAGRLAGSEIKPTDRGEKKLLDNRPGKC